MTHDTAVYARARKAGIPASSALALARYVAQDRDPLPEYGAPVTFDRDGFAVRLSLDYDEGISLEDIGLGTFEAGSADDWRQPDRYRPTTPGAIRNPRVGDSRLGRAGDRFYIPAQPRSERIDYYNGPTFGASKAVALDLAREAEDEEMRLATQDYGPAIYVLTVEASRDGVALGTASLGGCSVSWSDITRTYGEEYLAECFADLIPEAIADARATLASLCASEGCAA